MRNNLLKARKSLDLTQAELANSLGISTVAVRKYESGDRNPSNNMAVKYAEYFQRDLDYLFPDIFLLSFDTKRTKKSKIRA